VLRTGFDNSEEPYNSGIVGSEPKRTIGNAQPYNSGIAPKENPEKEIGRNPREQNSAEAGERHSAEAAPFSKNGAGHRVWPAAFLRRAEDWIKKLEKQPFLSDGEWKEACNVREELDSIAEGFDAHTGDPIGGWAARLSSELGFLIETNY
jgi:hypothetical protein